jgi:hypothetical protein
VVYVREVKPDGFRGASEWRQVTSRRAEIDELGNNDRRSKREGVDQRADVNDLLHEFENESMKQVRRK